MSTLSVLVGQGRMQPTIAKAVMGTAGTLTGAGTTAADAATIVTQVVALSGASNSGAILPASNAGDEYWIGSTGANSVKIYPPTGGTINGGASETLATTTACVVKFYTNLDCIAILGA